MEAQSAIEYQRDMSQCELARLAARAGCVGYHYLLHTLSQPCMYALGLAVMCHARMNYADLPDLAAAWRRACARPLGVLESHPHYWISLSSEGWSQLINSISSLTKETLHRSGNSALEVKLNGRLTVEDSVEVMRVMSDALLFRTVLMRDRQGTLDVVDLTPGGKLWVLVGLDQSGNYYYFQDRYFNKGWERPGFPYSCLPQEEIPIRIASRKFNLPPNSANEAALSAALQFISALSSFSLPPVDSGSQQQLLNQLRAFPPSDLVTSAIQQLERMPAGGNNPFPLQRNCQECRRAYTLKQLHWHSGNSSPHTLCSQCIRSNRDCPVCKLNFDADIRNWATSNPS